MLSLLFELGLHIIVHVLCPFLTLFIHFSVSVSRNLFKQSFTVVMFLDLFEHWVVLAWVVSVEPVGEVVCPREA